MRTPEILVVDDVKCNANILVLLLRALGYNADVAYDGDEAIELICEKSYDLVLVDYYMPKVNGNEVVRKVKKTQNIPAVVITGDPRIHTVFNSIKEGADRVIAKPVDMSELKALVEKFVSPGV